MSACEYDAPKTAFELGAFEEPFVVLTFLLRQKGEVVLLRCGKLRIS